jgi:FKBP-type peptidyl-prolyl cis-trans isomerase FkpA
MSLSSGYLHRAKLSLLAYLILCSLSLTPQPLQASQLIQSDQKNKKSGNEGVPGLLQFAEGWKETQGSADAIELHHVNVSPSTQPILVHKPTNKNGVVQLKLKVKKLEAQLNHKPSGAEVELQKQIDVLQQSHNSLLAKYDENINKLRVQLKQSGEREKNLQTIISERKQDNSNIDAARNINHKPSGAEVELQRQIDVLQQSHNSLLTKYDENIDKLRVQLKQSGEREKNLQTIISETKRDKSNIAAARNLLFSLYQTFTPKADVVLLQNKIDMLLKTDAALRKELLSSNEALEKTTQAMDNSRLLTQQNSNLKQDNAKLTQQNALLSQNLNDRERNQASSVPRVISLENDEKKQSYAAGVALGQDVLSLQNERQVQGLSTDRSLILSGIADAFKGNILLNNKELTDALAAADAKLVKTKAEVLKNQKRIGNSYAQKFSKEKGVKKADLGFLYLIDYEGDEAISNDNVIEIVVKETLTDGTVVQDMDASGNVVSQPLESFPPLFMDGIKLLKNHGSLTMVVPPDLAYGDKGYPPTIPPGATMIYHLRIAGTHPQNKSK